MIRIDQIRVRLPPALQDAARPFADHLARALADVGLRGEHQISSLTLPSMQAHPGDSPQTLAQACAQAIRTAMDGGPE